jgi:hypothetical protein
MEITQNQVKELFEYRDGELFWRVSQGRSKIGNKTGTLNSDGYLHTIISKKAYKNHRIIFLMFHGYLPKFIDHIDGNRSNNIINNLREATRAQNTCNAKTPSTNTSGVKGVCWSKRDRKWLVQVQINDKKKYSRCYEDLELAELVAIELRNKYHKEFARHA